VRATVLARPDILTAIGEACGAAGDFEKRLADSLKASFARSTLDASETCARP
jgi:hypothetical protein